MPDIDKILQELLDNRRLRESVTFTSRTYSDQPIIQTGKQLRERMERSKNGRPRLSDLPRTDYTPDEQPFPRTRKPQQQQLSFGQTPTTPREQQQTHEKIPERYYQLRELAGAQPTTASASWRGALAYGTRSANRLFYEQARLMEDFEDDYDFQGTYSQYFPTYSSMTLTQLRGYFSWRTRVRKGEMPEAPLSFAFLHVYELLCGVGTTPGEQGLADLTAFKDAFGATDAAMGSTFGSYLRKWIHDYVVYHQLDPSHIAERAGGMQQHVLTLLQAEEDTLRKAGLERKQDVLPEHTTPDDDALLASLNECSSYQPCGARLFRDHPDELRTIACETFRALVVHCSRRRKTDFVEGLYGSPSAETYTMFSSAVFYEPEPHPNCVVHLTPIETYTCRNGRWRRHLLFSATGRSSELGAIMHAVDAKLRARLDYAYPLKDRAVAAYVGKIIDKAIDELLAAQAEAERRHITIDLSQLAGIRAAAAITQEALLTVEERGTGSGAAEEAGASD
ncbi:MAG: TerB N-terminal domain-containing protein, partial [Atopobiaceae bacterium]|nr:TerB N-terminal domain-containing protein [Atopobiaceae bacterium]